MRLPGRILAVLLATVLLAACGNEPGSGDRPTVVLDEFTVAPQPVEWEAGRVEVAIENEGEFAHTLVVSDPDGGVVTATDLIEPGAEVSLPLDLGAGEYRLTCRIVVETAGEEVVDHYERGMVATVEVSPPS